MTPRPQWTAGGRVVLASRFNPPHAPLAMVERPEPRRERTPDTDDRDREHRPLTVYDAEDSWREPRRRKED
jgi:hypothetical protein